MTRGLGGESPANISFYLKGIHFPATAQDLLNHARQNGAPPPVLEVIEAMRDHDFQTMADVMKAYGEVERVRKGRAA